MNKKNKNVTSEMDIKGLIIIVCVLVVIAVVAYLLTVGAQKLGWFDEGYYKPEVPEAVISYDNINAGTIFNRKDKEYYVLIADFSDKESVYVNSLGSLYKEKEDSLPLYFVDTGDNINSSIVGSESKNAQDIKGLKVNGHTLIKISNGKNVKFVTGDENIKKELGL